MAIGDTEYLDAIAAACGTQGTSGEPDTNAEAKTDIANTALASWADGQMPYDKDGAAATATMTVADGDDATSGAFTEKEFVTLTSTDGTKRVYVVCATNESGGSTTGTVLTSSSDTGAGTLGADIAALGTCVAVGVNVTSVSQAAFLNTLKDAVEHANGHNGRITMSSDVSVADGAQTMTFTQKVEGIAGNACTMDTSQISQLSSTQWTGGIGTAASCTFTVSDGDAACGMAELGYLRVTSTDGTEKMYVIVDDAPAGTQAATGAAMSTGDDTGASTLPSGLNGAIAVTIPDLSSSTQNAVLVQFKAAIEAAAGHNGKIYVSEVPAQADGAQVITLHQATAGAAGNSITPEREGDVGAVIANFVSTGFSGGTGNTQGTYDFTPEPGSSKMVLANADNVTVVKSAVEDVFKQYVKKKK